MTGDSSRREKAQAVLFSLIMVVSMVGIGAAGFAGSAAAEAPPESLGDSPSNLQVSLLNGSTETVNATWGVNTTSETINVTNGTETDTQVADINVNDDSAKAIQYAISNASTENDTVQVGSGTYNGTLTVDAEGLTLEATEGAEPTIDAGGAEGTAVGIEATDVRVEGFTVENFAQNGITIFGGAHGAEVVNNTVDASSTDQGSSLAINTDDGGADDLLIKNNELGFGETGALQLNQNSRVNVTGNIISDAQGESPDNAFGILVDGGSDIEITENTISNASVNAIQVGGISGVSADVSNLDINSNNINYNANGVTILKEVATSASVSINENNIANIDNYGVYNHAKEVDTTSNWWGATNGPSVTYDGNGSAVNSNVNVDPASVELDSGSIDLDQNFIGTVNDPQNVTLNGSSNAKFSFDADVPGEVDGTLVLDIGGTEFVFKDVLDEGEINTTIGPDDADDSGKNGTSIAVSEGTGDRNVSVAGFDSAAAVEQAGTTKLIHVAKAAPNTGYFVTSMPQSGEFHEQDVADVTQYDGNADANEYSDLDTSNDVASVNQALFVNAESASARYGYTFDTDRSDQQTDFGSARLSTGWHVLGSNFNVSQNDTVNVSTDLQTQTSVDSADINVYPSTNPDGTGSFESDTKVSEYEAYYVYVHSEDNRPVFLPEYDPDADKNGEE